MSGKAEQLHGVFEHVKEHGGKRFKENPNAVQGLEPKLVEALMKLNPHELEVIQKLNEDLFKAGFGVSDEFRVSMV